MHYTRMQRIVYCTRCPGGFARVPPNVSKSPKGGRQHGRWRQRGRVQCQKDAAESLSATKVILSVLPACLAACSAKCT